jgi:hypothetical protein
VDLVGKDEVTQIERMSHPSSLGCSLHVGLRESVNLENTQLESRLVGLEGELRDLQEKDRLHLQETKTYVIAGRIPESQTDLG